MTVTAPADTETTKFEKWTFSGTEPTGLPNGWETSKEFTFKMPASNVTLGASYHTITKYEVKVTGGTIVGGNGDTGNYLPGTEVTVTAPADTDTKKFEKWTGGDNIIDAPSNWRNSSTFTFTMPADDVTLKAEYKTAYTLTVDGGKGTILVNGMAGSRALAGDQITVTETGSDKYHLFSSWQLTSSTALVEPSENWENSKTFTFKMPAGNVTLKADYKQLYDLTVNGGTIVNGTNTGIYLPGTEVTVVFDDSHDIAKQFKQWKSTDTEPEAPTAGWPEGGWQNSKKFTFKMPTGNVTLEAEYKTVYNVSVDDRKGTILVNGVEGSRALAGDEITVTETGSDEHHLFSSWELTSSTALVEPSENWENSKTFTFKMPAGNVTLKADYKQLYDLTVNGGTIVNGTNTGIYLPGTEVTVVFDDSHDIAKQFKQWKSTDTEPEAPDGGWTAANDSTSTTFTFKMPNGPVELVAQWSASSLDPEQRIDPDEPLDEDFGVEPAPMDTTGGTIAAVAVGGAAIWGGYEIATRVILHSLLPEGTAIPASRGQLALLVWNTAGRPEPAGAPAFADVTDPDMAKAAQWCTEQGTMGAKGDRFEPEGWTPKFKVIEVWNKTFPAA